MNYFKAKKTILSVISAALICLFFMSSAIAAPQTAAPGAYTGPAAKYVFLFIGDGMSFAQINSTEMYLGKQEKYDSLNVKQLSLTKFPVLGTAMTFDAESFIPDSASTATSIATGYKTLGGVISMDTSKTVKYETIAEMAKKKGLKIGVISSVSLDHATPACFYSHQKSRNDYHEISKQLVNSGFDFYGGGGLKQPTGPKKDQQDVLEAAKINGYKVVNNYDEFALLNNKSGKVIAINPVLDADKALPYEIDRTTYDLSLADYVQKGIEVIDNPNGFFMMVEAGKIDWAAHANDAGAAIHDTIALDKAVDEALKFYEKHPLETLIIITGDHECGGMTIGFAGTGYETFFDKISYQTMSYLGFGKVMNEYMKTKTKDAAVLEDLLPSIKNAFGLIVNSDPDASQRPGLVLSDYEVQRLRDALKQSMTPAKERKLNDYEQIIYGTYDPLTVTLTHILNNKAGLAWTSYSHTGLPVPVYAKGAGESVFDGYYDNTDIFHKMLTAMKLR